MSSTDFLFLAFWMLQNVQNVLYMVVSALLSVLLTVAFFMLIHMKGVNIMTMTEEARRARNEYARKWRAEHPESVRAANQRYWERKAEEARAAAAATSGEDPEELTRATAEGA
jgi:hypothetical protein